MNLCVVSSFSCTVEDYKSMVKDFDEEFPGVVSEYEIAVVNDHKVVTMVNVADMDGFAAMMSSPKMVEWDTANNNVDVVYALEQVD